MPVSDRISIMRENRRVYRTSFALIALLAASSASPAELGILTGGKRIIDRDPSNAADNCSGWVYGASPLLDATGRVGAMYVATDQITNHCSNPIGSEGRFGDVIALHTRNSDDTWSRGTTVVNQSNFPWMSDANFLAQHPESFVGHLASPSVVKVDGRYYMAFVGSLDDRNLCAGEHGATNGCGSCVDPWSYFVAMWAISDDGLHWRVRQRSADPLFIGRPPDAADRAAGSLYKGITRVSLLAADEGFQKYFYIATQFWSMKVLKMAMFRVLYDPNSEWGIGGDPQLWSWNRSTWVLCENGRIPDFYEALSEISLLRFSAPLSSILRTRVLGPQQFMALSSADYSGGFSWLRRSAVIRYATAMVLSDFGGESLVRSGIHTFADGFGYDGSVIDPVAIEESDGKLRLFFSSTDGDSLNRVSRDGQPDCARDPIFGALAPYVGTGIYEAVIEPIALRPTTITLRPTSFQIPNGALAHYTVCVRTLDGNSAEGLVTVVDSGKNFAETLLIGGCAEIDLRMNGVGAHMVAANYDIQNLWQASRSETIVQTVVEQQRRRAVRP
jgi:hypothetical protein